MSDQWREALAAANSVRSAVAAVKNEVRSLSRADGLWRVADIVEENDVGDAGAMLVEGLIGSVRHLSPSRAARLFPYTDRRLRELTVMERLELAAVLRYASRLAGEHRTERSARS